MTPGLFTIHQDGRAKFKKRSQTASTGRYLVKQTRKLKVLAANPHAQRRTVTRKVGASTQKRRLESQQEEPQSHFAVSHALLCISSSEKWTSQTKHRHSEGRIPFDDT